MTPPVLILGTDPLANVDLLLGALARETFAADSSDTGRYLSHALGLIHHGVDGYSGLLALALDMDERAAADRAQERGVWLQSFGVYPFPSVGIAS